MTFRYPDKPKLEIDGEALKDLPRAYLCQAKVDGWRCVVEVTEQGPFIYTGRERKPIPITREVAAEFEAALRRQRVKPGTLLDGEWVGRRPACRDEMILLFDLLRDGEQDMYDQPAEHRVKQLHAVLGVGVYRFIVPTWFPWQGGSYYDEFDWCKREGSGWAEGVVLKRLDSRYIGSVRACALNPAWIKAKFRKGEDGMTPVE